MRPTCHTDKELSSKQKTSRDWVCVLLPAIAAHMPMIYS